MKSTQTARCVHQVLYLIALVVPTCLVSLTAGAFSYDKIRPGTLSGKVVVQWLEPDIFLFIPDAKSPFSFTRASGETIEPGRMITDGGSVPRAAWILRNYSPWGFTPAFIVHDWLFHMQKCKLDGYQSGSLEKAADIMAEVMKTMIEQKIVDANWFTVGSMYYAVNSPVAKEVWESEECVRPPASMFLQPPLREFELNFDRSLQNGKK